MNIEMVEQEERSGTNLFERFDMNIYEKLNQARKLFHEKQMKKSGHNKFAGYDYFTISDFITPALSIFEELRLIGLVSFGKEYATLDIVNCEKPEEKIQFTSPMSEANLKGCHPVQNLGAVHTYLRRYLWVAALEIVEQDALDSAPRLATKGDNKGTGPRLPALAGIGDDLSEDWKVYLENLAADVVKLVSQNLFEEANFEMRREPLDDTQQLYLERFLDSKTRSALRKFNSTKGN
jgi:hypothetical protein